MQRRLGSPQIGSNPIIPFDSERRLIDFAETRFRVHSLKLQDSLRPVANELASVLGVSLSTLDLLKAEGANSLREKTFCAFDFLDLKRKTAGCFQHAKWVPLAVFAGGIRVLSLHAAYDQSGSHLVGLTMWREGQDEYTKCTTAKAALKVGKSYLRTYVLEKP